MAKKIFLISLLFLIFAGQVQAAGLVPCGGYEEPSCTFCDFFVLINNVIRLIMFTLTPVVAVAMLVVGGVMFLFAGAKPSILIQAKGIITSVFIGLIIIFCAWVIVNTVLTRTGIVESPSILQWWQIDCQ